MRKAPHFLTMAAVLVLGTHVAFAQGARKDGAQSQPTTEQKKSPGGLRGPDGFTPQESSPANGGINVRGTTGQGSAAGASKLSADQRSKIIDIFREHKVTPTKLDSPVHLGTHVSQDTRSYPVPPDIVEIHPEWRGYNFIQAANEILIIDPGTREIVEILEI